MATRVAAHRRMDGRGEYPIGDVTRTHVLNVYNAPERRKLRERTEKRRSVSPCDRRAFL